MILNIYKEQLDDVDLSLIVNEFVCGSEHRVHVLIVFFSCKFVTLFYAS